jgi:hypothetical protein
MKPNKENKGKTGQESSGIAITRGDGEVKKRIYRESKPMGYAREI